MNRRLCLLWVVCGGLSCASTARAQTRAAIIQAEDRRASTAKDLVLLRSGTRSEDPQTRRLAIRALGRLERPSLIPDIVPALKNPLPEVREEAANAVAQAAQGWRGTRLPADARALSSAVDALAARLPAEAEADVRAAISESIGRLPYVAADEVERAERTLLSAATPSASAVDRLGVAKGFEALIRSSAKLRPPGADAVALLRGYASAAGEGASGARVRRLSVDALIEADAMDAETLARAAKDPDAQVRRGAMRAVETGHASGPSGLEVLRAGLRDDAAMVRLEAVRAASCDEAAAAAQDPDTHVVLAAIDRLGTCSDSPDAIALLEHALDNMPDAGVPRGWHRAAHALVALATAVPDRAASRVPPLAVSSVWQLRLYAARAATALKDSATLERLASTDDNDNVREAAVDGLSRVAGHDADAVYVANLSRHGYQIIRAAARALAGTPHADAARPALEAALERLTTEGADNSHDARDAIAKALGVSHRDEARRPAAPAITAEELRRLASPRARISIRDVGTFEIALITSEAPATVLRFAHLAEAGYYNGTTFHRIVPNFVIQGGSPGANEYIGDAMFMRDEVGLWPHVRGAVGISTRGHDTGDAQMIIDLVDNPRLDHGYTVFAQVLNGIEVVDRILEGDVIDRIEIIR